eukprot:sb/3462231/
MTLIALKESEQGGSEEASPDGDTVADLLPSLPNNANNNKGNQRRNSVLRRISIGTIGFFQPKPPTEEDPIITLRDVSRARNRIQDYLHQTQIIQSSNVNSMLKVKVLFKAENFQKSGSYKVRGILNHILNQREQRLQKRTKGRRSSLPQTFSVMTSQAGDFAEAAACAASMAGVSCASVVPKSTCRATLEILHHYKSRVMVHTENCPESVREKAEDEAEESGYKIFPEFDPTIIAGYGTLVSEFLKQTNSTLDAIIVLAGDGTLSAATAITAKEMDEELDVYLVTKPGDPLIPAMIKGSWPHDTDQECRPPSIAPDLNLTVHPKTRDALLKHCEKTVITVEDTAITDGMKFVFERLKVVVDINSAACVAALFSDTFMQCCDTKEYRRVGIMLTGGNCSVQNLPFSKGAPANDTINIPTNNSSHQPVMLASAPASLIHSLIRVITPQGEAFPLDYKLEGPVFGSPVAGIVVSEFLKQTNSTLDAIIVLAGDGTLSAATAITAKEMDEELDVYLVTKPGDPLIPAMIKGSWPHDTDQECRPPSIAPDLNLTVHPKTRDALLKHCEKTVITVEDTAITDGMKFVFERLKVVVDINSAACVAALFSDTFMQCCDTKEYSQFVSTVTIKTPLQMSPEVKNSYPEELFERHLHRPCRFVRPNFIPEIEYTPLTMETMVTTTPLNMLPWELQLWSYWLVVCLWWSVIHILSKNITKIISTINYDKWIEIYRETGSIPCTVFDRKLRKLRLYRDGDSYYEGCELCTCNYGLWIIHLKVRPLPHFSFPVHKMDEMLYVCEF